MQANNVIYLEARGGAADGKEYAVLLRINEGRTEFKIFGDYGEPDRQNVADALQAISKGLRSQPK